MDSLLHGVEGFMYPNEIELQWSVLIVLYPFLTGLVAGAFILASLQRVFKVEAVKPTYRLALLTGLAFLLIAPLPLQLHLGHPERSFEMFELLGEPFDGAVWSGPPFAASKWAGLTRSRNPGSPVWLPQFQDGSFVRFMNQDGSSTPPGTPWGPMRVVYLQYGSDAVTFFEGMGEHYKAEIIASIPSNEPISRCKR